MNQLGRLRSLAGSYPWGGRCFRQFSSANFVDERVSQLTQGNRAALSRTITLIESQKMEHREKADQIMERLLNQTPERRNQAFRIGICGAPGAGKSSVIEKLGLHLVRELRKKLAVLAIDPSSQRTGGSILGDKTRMNDLSLEEDAYLRPSPTRGVLGGVALNTSEVQLLCEHFGFDVILVETVGVGQSEVEIDNVVDFVVLVVPPGSGDSLQGSKKGIMDIADLICVNKFDQEYKQVCRRLQRQIEGALGLTMSKHAYSQLRNRKGDIWQTPVELISAQDNYQIERIWEEAMRFKETVGKEYLIERRQNQLRKGMWNYLSSEINIRLKSGDMSVNHLADYIAQVEKELASQKVGGHLAAQRIMGQIFKPKN